jgi:hypothetical protein
MEKISFIGLKRQLGRLVKTFNQPARKAAGYKGSAISPAPSDGFARLYLSFLRKMCHFDFNLS